MRRNFDLIRKLVLALEDSPPRQIIAYGITLEGFTEEEIGYHSYLLVDAGLAAGTDVHVSENVLPNWHLLHLTWAGHDFADAARDNTRWSKATTLVKDKAGSVTFDVLKQLLVRLIENTVGI